MINYNKIVTILATCAIENKKTVFKLVPFEYFKTLTITREAIQ